MGAGTALANGEDRLPTTAALAAGGPGEPASTLRAAMEIIMTSGTSVAVVDDGGRFGGVVTLEGIRAALADECRAGG